MPWVASEACWRKGEAVGVASAVETVVDGVVMVGSGIWRTSIGIERRWQANMAFMIGMY